MISSKTVFVVYFCGVLPPKEGEVKSIKRKRGVKIRNLELGMLWAEERGWISEAPFRTTQIYSPKNRVLLV
jgi:hypothetical protein